MDLFALMLFLFAASCLGALVGVVWVSYLIFRAAINAAPENRGRDPADVIAQAEQLRADGHAPLFRDNEAAVEEWAVKQAEDGRNAATCTSPVPATAPDSPKWAPKPCAPCLAIRKKVARFLKKAG